MVHMNYNILKLVESLFADLENDELIQDDDSVFDRFFYIKIEFNNFEELRKYLVKTRWMIKPGTLIFKEHKGAYDNNDLNDKYILSYELLIDGITQKKLDELRSNYIKNGYDFYFIYVGYNLWVYINWYGIWLNPPLGIPENGLYKLGATNGIKNTKILTDENANIISNMKPVLYNIFLPALNELKYILSFFKANNITPYLFSMLDETLTFCSSTENKENLSYMLGIDGINNKEISIDKQDGARTIVCLNYKEPK